MPMLVAANFDPQANEQPENLNLERRPTGTSPSAPGFIFVWAISSRVSKASARLKPYSSVGRSLGWPQRIRTFAGAGEQVPERSRDCPSWQAIELSFCIAIPHEWKRQFMRLAAAPIGEATPIVETSNGASLPATFNLSVCWQHFSNR
jgi:hypothetical protein